MEGKKNTQNVVITKAGIQLSIVRQRAVQRREDQRSYNSRGSQII